MKKIKEMHIFQNPDFDEVFVFSGMEVPTSKKQFKPLGLELQEKINALCPELPFKELFFKSNKENAQSFIKSIKDKLEAKKKKRWPYIEKIMLTVGVTGTKKMYEFRDLDNLLKSIFDAFKGIVFVDDSQIEITIATKQIIDKNVSGWMVGLRVLQVGIIDKYTPGLFGQEQVWGQAYVDKFSKAMDEIYNSIELY